MKQICLDKDQSSYYAYIVATFETGYKNKLFLFRTEFIADLWCSWRSSNRYRNWKPNDARKFGHDVSVRPPDHPPVHHLHVSRCQMSLLVLHKMRVPLSYVYH